MTQAAPGIGKSRPSLDFWFEFGSQYSYLSVMRIGPLAAAHGVDVRWRPFLLGPIFRSLGWNTSPFVLQKQKGEYAWKDLERQARKYGLPWRRPSQFPRSAVLPARIALLGAQQPWSEAFAREAISLNFVHDEEIDAEPAMRRVLDGLGLPSSEILAQAQSDENKLRLRQQTEEAQRLGIFGAPTFMVRGEMFWGNDRLEDALAFCSEGT